MVLWNGLYKKHSIPIARILEYNYNTFLKLLNVFIIWRTFRKYLWKLWITVHIFLQSFLIVARILKKKYCLILLFERFLNKFL